MMERHGLDREAVDRLRKLFYAHCSASARAELSLRAWLDWTAGWLAPSLATLLFQARLRPAKLTWRLVDFSDFCMVFGAEDARTQLSALVQAALAPAAPIAPNAPPSRRAQAEALMRLLAADVRSSSASAAQDPSRSLSSRSILLDDDVAERQTSAEEPVVGVALPPPLRAALRALEEPLSDEALLEALLGLEPLLPGLRDVGVLACCLFGVRPRSPLLEMRYVTELRLRSEGGAANVGEEVCVLSKAWWDEWMRSVGGAAGGGGRPLPEIPNASLLRQLSPAVLLPETVVGVTVEAVPPPVFAALQMWYGGGPRVARRVLLVDGRPTVELFPLRVVLEVYSPFDAPPAANPSITVSRIHREEPRDRAKEKPSTEQLLSRWIGAIGVIVCVTSVAEGATSRTSSAKSWPPTRRPR